MSNTLVKEHTKLIHQMGLYEEYFAAIKTGRKKMEVRLNDEKRRRIKIGDSIKFIKVPEQDESLQVQVMDLTTYETFQAMYEDIPFEAFDCAGWMMKEMLEGTYDIYTPEQEEEWGVLAITIKY